MTKQFPTASFARANILPRLTQEQARENSLAEIGELGALHACNNCGDTLNPGREAEGREIWERINGRAMTRTPGTLWQALDDYSVASNSWTD